MARLLAEANMLLGWNPDYALSMQARRFFVILRESRKLDFEREAQMLWDLVDVAFCAQAKADWVKETKGKFWKRFNPTPVRKVLDNKTAGKMLMGIFEKAGQNG